ncbi:hypothetical protein [Herbiconiux sp. YIM B11900]|uniref:hypothetical protein n=1 Tax=Herbiconiux sp. YIM B11900 TaxID=3404131 RepID=UPI003F86CA0E
MSKKIDSALSKLTEALKHHAEVVSADKVRADKVARANAKVRRAAAAYASAVYSRTATESPFLDIPDPRLAEETVASLKAERDAIKARKSAAKDGAKGSAPKHGAAEDAAPESSDEAATSDSGS